MSFRNFKSKLKQHFWFSKQEFTQFIILTLSLGFIYSFRQWGETTFNPTEGIWNLLVALILIGISLFIHHAGQRLTGLHLGYKVEQQTSWPIMLFGLVLCFLTNGTIRFLAGSGTIVKLMPQHRIGAFRYGPQLSHRAAISVAGPLLNVAFAILVAILGWALILPPELATALFSLNLWMAACNLLPIPPLDGIYVFYWSRFAYVFVFASIASYAFLSIALPAYTFIAAIAIGIILAYLWATYDK